MPAATNQNNRNTKIDILRAIALICIIIAHSEPNTTLAQIRNFDVVLMTLLLGTSFRLSFSKKKIHYFDYLKKRFQRLIVPTWVFLTIFFVIFYLIAYFNRDSYYFNLRQIIGSYTLLDGIGFIWIMRVFFLVAVVSPFLLIINNKLSSYLLYLLFLTMAYFVYVLLITLGQHLPGSVQKIYTEYFIYAIGYGLIASFGMRLIGLSKKETDLTLVAFIMLTTGLAFYHHFEATQGYKYPPTIYYISYGISASLFLYKLLDVQSIRQFFENPFVFFLSQSSSWIYFWHIIFIYLVMLFGKKMPVISGNFITRFLFIFSLAVITTYIHEFFETKMSKRKQASV